MNGFMSAPVMIITMKSLQQNTMKNLHQKLKTTAGVSETANGFMSESELTTTMKKLTITKKLTIMKIPSKKYSTTDGAI